MPKPKDGHPRNLHPESATTIKQKKFAANLTSRKFKSPRSAMIAAGYSKNTPVASVLNRPLVKSELTEAMQQIGLRHTDIVLPIKEALKATRSFVSKTGAVIITDVPDHKYRLEAARDAVAILGGVPKVGEGTAVAHGLNLFVAIDNGGGQRVQASTHAMRDPKTISQPSISIQVEDHAPRNRQAGQPDPRLND